MNERMFTVTAKDEEWDEVFHAFGTLEGSEGYTSASHRAETRISEQLGEQGYEWHPEDADSCQMDATDDNAVLVARITSRMEPLEVYNELKRLYGDRPEVVDDIRSLLGETGYQ